MDNQEFQIPAEAANWVETAGCAVTICDKDCNILFQNEEARKLYAKHGDLRGRNLMPCHNERSREIIRRLLATGQTNTYTIEKGPIRKVIFQTPWRRGGEIAGIAEISIVLPPDMPHYVR